MIRRGQRARDGVPRPFRLLSGEELVDGFLEPPLQQELVAGERNAGARVRRRARCPTFRSGGSGQELAGQMEAMNGVEEEQRPHALVQILATPPEGIQGGALSRQILERQMAQAASSAQSRRAGSVVVMMEIKSGMVYKGKAGVDGS